MGGILVPMGYGCSAFWRGGREREDTWLDGVGVPGIGFLCAASSGTCCRRHWQVFVNERVAARHCRYHEDRSRSTTGSVFCLPTYISSWIGGQQMSQGAVHPLWR